MKRGLHIAFVLFILMNGTSFGQVGTSEIGSVKIGRLSLATDSIGKFGLARCRFPSPCDPGACAVYTFIGSGSWENPANWLYGMVPPEFIYRCEEIRISPIGNTKSVMVLPRTVFRGGKVIVDAGKRLVIPRDFRVRFVFLQEF